MFKESEMYVPMESAMNKVTEVRKEMDEKIEGKNALINYMKCIAKDYMKGYLKIRNSSYKIGIQTPFTSDGMFLFTGDEVEFKHSGKKGIIVMDGGFGFKILTNKEVANLVSMEELMRVRDSGVVTEGMLTGFGITITKHYNTLIDGDKVAIGRRTGEAFIAHIGKDLEEEN